jgi:FtsH-binding integral membrane protein
MRSAAISAPAERAAFIRRTYAHLAAAVLAFVGIEYLLVGSPLASSMVRFIAGNRFGWLMILGGFILVGWLARSLATSIESPGMQYLGLGLFVVAEAVIFLPLIYIAMGLSDVSVLPTAAILTLLLFAGLTFTAFTTRKDFSFLGGILTMGAFIALGLIVCAVLFGFTLGLVFSGAMVIFACAAILYDTSNVIHHFRTDQHVAASLELFASVALLFWYILSIVMSLSRR